MPAMIAMPPIWQGPLSRSIEQIDSPLLAAAVIIIMSVGVTALAFSLWRNRTR